MTSALIQACREARERWPSIDGLGRPCRPPDRLRHTGAEHGSSRRDVEGDPAEPMGEHTPTSHVLGVWQRDAGGCGVDGPRPEDVQALPATSPDRAGTGG